MLNIFRTMQLRREASAAEDWHAELHYGGLAMVQAAGIGVIAGAALGVLLWGLS